MVFLNSFSYNIPAFLGAGLKVYLVIFGILPHVNNQGFPWEDMLSEPHCHALDGLRITIAILLIDCSLSETIVTQTVKNRLFKAY